jgi:formylglycine-generating enzyme required for sulfatase activity
MGGRGDYPWGQLFAATHLNCEESWKEEMSSTEEFWREASTTAVTTYPQGVSQAGMWDGSGNIWEWMNNPYTSGGPDMALRGGAWNLDARDARVSSRDLAPPASFVNSAGLRVVVAPVL